MTQCERTPGFDLDLLNDISDPEEVQVTLHESVEILKQLSDAATEGIFIHHGGIIVAANQAMASMFGYEIAELVGKNGLDLLVTESRKLASSHIASSFDRPYEVVCVRKDGTTFEAETCGKPIVHRGQSARVAVIRDITDSRRVRENLRFYVTHITKAQEEEKRRIARELHDDAAQRLSLLSLKIETLMNQKEVPRTVVRQLGQLKALTVELLEDIRRFCHELRPEVLDQRGLVIAVRQLIAELSAETHINGSVNIVGPERRVPGEVELFLYRITQEALNNVKKHSDATRTTVIIEFDSNSVTLSVHDNGRGFQPPETLTEFAGLGKLGLIGIQERARMLNGRFSLRSEIGGGTVVEVEVMV